MDRSDKLRWMIEDDEAVLITSYPNIFYYSGFESEDACLVITKNDALLFTDSRYTIQAGIQSHDYEVCDIFKMEEIIKSLKQEILCFEEDLVSVSEFSKLQKTSKKLKPFSKMIKRPRRIKDNYEISKMA